MDHQGLSKEIFFVKSYGKDGKESTFSVVDPGSIPGLERSPGEENGMPLQYSCLESPMVRGSWQALVLGVTKIWTQLSDEHFHFHGTEKVQCLETRLQGLPWWSTG